MPEPIVRAFGILKKCAAKVLLYVSFTYLLGNCVLDFIFVNPAAFGLDVCYELCCR